MPVASLLPLPALKIGVPQQGLYDQKCITIDALLGLDNSGGLRADRFHRTFGCPGA